MIPSVTAQSLVEKSLRKIGVLNRLDIINDKDLEDGLEGLWQVLDSWNSQHYMIPYVTHLEFPVVSTKRIYTYGPDGDFDSPRPLAILDASWRDEAGVEYPIKMIQTQIYTEGEAYKSTTVGRPYQIYYEPSYPVSQIFLQYFPLDKDTLLLKVKLPFSAEICPCVDFSCAGGGVDPLCPEGNVNPEDYNITVAGCSDGDDACILSGQTQMSDFLETQCTTDCNQSFTEDFQYDPGTGDITITATATPIPRTSMKPAQLCLTEKTEFPPGYQNLIIWTLSEFMCSEYNMPVPPIVAKEAAKAERRIKAINARPNELVPDNALTYPGRFYSVVAGPYGNS